jgi:putative spermidine/putrescine transport system substrate-binding protein
MRVPLKLAVLPMALASMAVGPAPQKPAAQPDDAPQPLNLVLRQGPTHDGIIKVFGRPYADATQTTLGEPAWDGSVDALKQIFADKKADLALVDGATLAAGCRAHVFDKPDWNSLGRDRFLPQAVSECGAGAYLSATVLAWDSQKLQNPPSWADFWDVAKHPGRRGLQKAARRNLEIALLADGVAPADIYPMLRTPGGVDRAFRKLDQLKPYIEWWDQPSQPLQFLTSGKVLLTSLPAAPIPWGGKIHIGVQWAASLTEGAFWAVPQDPAHPRAAASAILIATDSARQADFAKATSLGPSTHGGVALLPAELRARNPSLLANLQASLLLDEGFWLDNGDKLEARFAAWVVK